MSAPPSASGLIASGAGAFSDAELDTIEQLGDRLALIKAPLGAYNLVDHNKRITKVAAIGHDAANKWIYDRMIKVVHVLNRRYRFRIDGFREPLQFMVYRDVDGAHFNWHIDQGPSVQRKLSLTLQLTDPASYEGGDLEFKAGNEITSAARMRGTLIAFPSHLVHRVTPVTSGTRKSIVAWVA
ncbi:MAG TPA: 2OG-Fe(II) oxygenase [Rhizomicrobium sp.]|jgi:PKHD-type hydroxylase|nr:2OG-Fe(II) oxygenase [Rhizomicrobium sp.]